MHQRGRAAKELTLSIGVWRRFSFTSLLMCGRHDLDAGGNLPALTRRHPMSSTTGTSSKHPIEIDDDDDELMPSAKRQASADGRSAPATREPAAAAAAATAATPAILTLPRSAAPASNKLRGVSVPPGWCVYSGSLLATVYGRPQVTSSKVAAFDFDGCLADTPVGGFDPNAWKLQYPHVPQVLSSLVASGHTIVIVTNESMDRFKTSDVIRKAIAKKVGRLEGFAQKVNVPMLVLCATAKDAFRKPGTAAWFFACDALSACGVAVDKSTSFFVGDAAGRKGDHSDSDKAFAAAAALPFYDEKTFFEKLHSPTT